MSTISKLSSLLRCQNRFIYNKAILNTGSFIKFTQRRDFSSVNSKNAVGAAKPAADVSTDVRPLGEKIKETTKTVSYMGVILVGVGVTGVIFYFVFRELFSSKSPNSIYSAALDKCIENPYVSDSLGAPIKGFGEETSRRRRTHVSHAFYERDGANCIRMQFYIKGTRNEATVQLDMKENESGKFEYRYLLVQLNDYSRRVIVLEDNRAAIDKKSFKSEPLQSLPSIM